MTSWAVLSFMGAFCSSVIRNPDDDHGETLVSIPPPIGQSFSNSIPSPIDRPYYYHHIPETRRVLFYKCKRVLSKISSDADSKSRFLREARVPVRRSGLFETLSRSRRRVGFGSVELSPAEKMGNCIGVSVNKVRNATGKCLGFGGKYREHAPMDRDDGDRENFGDLLDDFIDLEAENLEEKEKLVRAEKELALTSPEVPGLSYADALRGPAQKQLYISPKSRDEKLRSLDPAIEENEKYLQLLPSQKKDGHIKKDAVNEWFVPITEEEEALVDNALSYPDWTHVLVSHDKSNIDITGEVLQCLKPLKWLNDEVINLYLELLKERESREPQKFLKCHFFNTFFYKKLISGRDGYNYQAVKRWTTQRKLGYNLLDCEKIFVPIHKNSHWCLAIINKKETKFQYLDSLEVFDDSQLRQVMNVLARYYADEVKDRTGKDINVDSWEKEFVINRPQQENMSDCGMFMIKYVDFHSRDIELYFDQGHMQYFRLRTAKEILKLRAE